MENGTQTQNDQSGHFFLMQICLVRHHIRTQHHVQSRIPLLRQICDIRSDHNLDFIPTCVQFREE